MQRVDRHVHERDAARPRLVEAEEPERGALDRDRRVPPHEVEHLPGDAIGERPAALDLRPVEREVRHGVPVAEEHAHA